VSKYPFLFAELLADSDRWSEEDIAKLAGRNLIRVFRQVEQVSCKRNFFRIYSHLLFLTVFNEFFKTKPVKNSVKVPTLKVSHFEPFSFLSGERSARGSRNASD
jgi:Membrane dipeptidase (Peptidase family M19)